MFDGVLQTVFFGEMAHETHEFVRGHLREVREMNFFLFSFVCFGILPLGC